MSEPSNIIPKVVFEDHRIRAEELRIPPGKSTVRHTHREDFLVIVLKGTPKLRISHDDGSFQDHELPTGAVRMPPAKGDTHWATNLGREEYWDITVHLKEG